MSKIKSLQFLRFLAFLNIFLWHLGDTNVFTGWNIKNGTFCAVSFFFILSGFLSGYRVKSDKENYSWKMSWDYLKHKVSKFYPLFFITTLLTFPCVGVIQQISDGSARNIAGTFWQLTKNLLLVQSWFQNGYYSFNGVAWFLSTIVFLYLMMPMIERIVIRLQQKGKMLPIMCVFVLVLAIAYSYLIYKNEMNLQFWVYVFPPSRLPEYICGFGIGAIVCEKKIYLNRYVWSVIEIAIFLSVTLLISLDLPEWLARSYFWILPNCLMICVFLNSQGLFSKLFSLRPFYLLGEISFECFIIHQVLITYFNHFIGELSRRGKLFSLFYLLGITLVISFWLHQKQMKTDSVSRSSNKLKD